MSDDKIIPILNDTCTEPSNERFSEGESRHASFVNGLKTLQINPEKINLQTSATNSGFSLHDLAQAHFNRGAIRDSSAEQTTVSSKFNLDFNNLKLEQPIKFSNNFTAHLAKDRINQTSQLKLATTTPAASSISVLAKQHQSSIETQQNNSKTPLAVSTASGFTIPSLFGECSDNTSSQSLNKLQNNNYRIPPNSFVGPNIDLSSALLLKEERPQRQSVPEKEQDTQYQLVSLKTTVSTDQLISSIDLLLSNVNTETAIKTLKTDPSPLGQVLCKQWKLKGHKKVKNSEISCTPHVKKELIDSSRKIKPFIFDVPSPDDIIIAAQSRIFGRRQ